MEQEVVYLGILLFPYSLGDGLSGLYVLLYYRKEFDLAFNLDNEPDHGLNIGLDHVDDLDLDHDHEHKHDHDLDFNLDIEPDHDLETDLDLEPYLESGNGDVNENNIDLDIDIDTDLDLNLDLSNNALSIACIIIFASLEVPSR